MIAAWSVCRTDVRRRTPVRSLITIECDGARQSSLALERPPEKLFGCHNIPLGAQTRMTVFPAVSGEADQGGAISRLFERFNATLKAAGYACRAESLGVDLRLYDLAFRVDHTHAQQFQRQGPKITDG